MKRILIAPDKFKGSLSALEVCEAIAAGLRQKDKTLDIHLHPMADGGDGSLEVLALHRPLQRQNIETFDPLGRSLSSFYYTAGRVAFIELAKASGLVLLKENEQNPLRTSTYGTGLMIADAIRSGCDTIYLFLGGSATHDGGMGIAKALGVEFFDADRKPLPARGENLSKVASISAGAGFDRSSAKFYLLCDVTNPLYGPAGAAQVYARQKGADDAMITQLDMGLRHFSAKLLEHSGVDVSDLPGSGAAGGIAAALVGLFGAELQSGTARFAKLTRLETQIQLADLVISGEGSLDAQSLHGKVVDGVARLCQKHFKPLVLLVGKNDLSDQEQKELGADRIYAVMDRAKNLEDAMENAAEYLKNLTLKADFAVFNQRE